MNSLRESSIERKLVSEVRKRGGLAFKFVSPGCDGVPDRLVLMKDGHIAFVELKAFGKKLRPIQVRRKEQIENLGIKVYCIDAPEQIPEILKRIGGEAK